MTITLVNNNTSAITGVQFTDNYPAPLHMANAPSGVIDSNSCGGTVTAAPDGTSVALSNGTIPANQSCALTINVVGTSSGSSVNHTGTVTNANAPTGADATATLVVLAPAPTVFQTIQSSTISVGGHSLLQIFLANNSNTVITGVQFTDNYPTPLHMANASSGVVVGNACGGTVTAAPNGTSVALSNGVIVANAGCGITLDVVGTSMGASVNHTGVVTSANAEAGADATATLIVTNNPLLSAPRLAKTFTPTSVSVGGMSQMTFTLTNTSGTDVTGAQFTDAYPAGMAAAPSGALVSNTCGGFVNPYSMVLGNGTIPGGGTCSIVIKMVGVSAGVWNNQTSALLSGNAQSGPSASAALTVTNVPLLSAPTVTKAFAPASVAPGDTSQMTITLSNPNNSPIAGALFHDNYPIPGGLANAPNGVVASNTCSGTVDALANDVSASLVNGTIPANQSCAVVINVVGSVTTTNYTGQIFSANAQSAGTTNATLTVTNGASLAAPTVTKAFMPSTVTVGGASQMTITLSNNDLNNDIFGVQFTDIFPLGMANGAVVSNTCGGTLTAAPGAGNMALFNGTIPADFSCSVVIDVVDTVVGPSVNQTSTVISTNANPGASASGTLTATSGNLLSAPTASKTFAPANVTVGGSSQMTITLSNPNASAITSAQFTDSYPAGLANAANGVVLSNSCGGSVSAGPNAMSAALANGTILPNSTCSVVINVVGTAAGSSVNHTGPVASANASAGADASATLTVTGGNLLSAPTVSKAFAPAGIVVNNTSQMTITLSNNDASNAITGAHFVDTYPAPLHMANAPSGVVVSNSCGGSVTAAANGTSTALANGTVPAGGTCNVVIEVVGTSIGISVNHTGSVSSGNANPGADATATLTVTSGNLLSAPTVTKAFAPASVTVGGTSQMTITLSNPNGSAITSAQFTDNYPAGMANAPSGVVVSNSCGGSVTAAANGTSTALTNGTIPSSGQCAILINVIGTAAGSSLNHTGSVLSANASAGADASATLTVTGGNLLSAPTVSKAFAPAGIVINNTSQMTITLANANASAITGAQFADVYPPGIANAPSGAIVSNTCGGTLTAAPNAASAALVNGIVPANGGTCSVVVKVVGTSAGTVINQTGAVLSGNAANGNSASATLTVTNGALLSGPTVTKTFVPSSVVIGGISQMTITLSNPNASAITGALFTDSYPVGMANAPSGVVSNTCGAVTAVPNDTSASLANGIVPAGGMCSLVINVIGTAAGTSNNQTGAVTSTNASASASASATLTVTGGNLLAAPTVSKAFAPANVMVGGTSQMTITLSNSSNSAITGAQFTDNYPFGMASTPNGPVMVTNTCGGTLVADPNVFDVSLTNGTIPANGACNVVVNVVGTSPGTSVNHTGPVSSANANVGADASATLTVTNGSLLSAPTVNKAFAPASVAVGGTAQMTITLSNGNNNAITSAQFNDTYPAGMANASSGVVVSNSCGGTLTAIANDVSAALANGTIPANNTCSVVINVVGTAVGSSVNHTGSVLSANANAGADATDTLTVTNGSLLTAPMVNKDFAPSSITVGGISQMSIGLINPNMFTPITGVQFADNYPAGMANAPSGVVVSNTCGGTVTAAPNGGSAMLANGTILPNQECIIRINVVGTSAGIAVNHTGGVTSANASAGADASATLTIAPGALLPAPTMTKAFASSNIIVGGTSQMTITMSNASATAIVGAQFSDFYPSGMSESIYGVLSNTCGGFLDEYADSVALANGTIPAQGNCSIVVQMGGVSPGAWLNQTSSIASGNAVTGNRASGTLTVINGSLLSAPTVAKTFVPATVTVGGTSQMTITLTNNDPNSAVSGVQIWDSYPGPLHIANAPSNVVVSNSCSGTLMAAPNGILAILGNGTVPPNGSCSVVLNVVGTSAGTTVNHTGLVASANANAGADASATLTVTSGNLLSAPSVSKTFAPSSVTIGGTSQMTISLTNNDPNSAVIGAQFVDTYPAGMANASSGVVLSNSCGGTLTAAANGTSATLANGAIPAGGACSVVINVIGTATGSSVNHTGPVASTNAITGADASANLTVMSGALLPAATVTKAFAPASVTVGGTSQMTITLNNGNASAITGAQFADSYPAGMANAPNGVLVSNSCGGAVTAAANGTSTALANGTIPANQSCAIKINIVGTSAGGSVNHTGALASANANPGADASATLTVTGGALLTPPTVTKAFVPASVMVGGASQMTIALSNTNGNAITGALFTDNYPAGIANASSGVIASNSCGGNVIAAANGTSASLANGTVPSSGQCMVVINVVGTSVGSSVNHTGAVSSANANAGMDATATLTVTGGGLLTAPTVTKAFVPASVTVGGASQMTIVLNNGNASAITGTQFTDTYPAGMANASSGVVVSNTCGGNVTAAANGTSALLANGTIPATGTCSVVIDVVGTSAGTSLNHTGAVTSTNASPGADASATLTVTSGSLLTAPTVTKVFAPASVTVGGTSQMTITLNNGNASAINGAQFIDTYPAPLHMANAPSSVVASNSCGGTVTAAASGTSAALSSGTIPASGSCSVVINVVGTSAGISVNHTGAVTSTNASPGADASATLAVTGGTLLNAPTVTKAFVPASVTVGGASQMTITLSNADPGNPVNGAQFTDAYPAGLANASNGVVVSNSCGGTVTATPGWMSTALTNGTIPAGGMCSVVISVVGTSAGTVVNHTGPVVSANANTGADATATLTVTGAGNNHAPVAVGDAVEVTLGGTANTLVGDPNNPGSVLDNDIDSDGDTLTATKLSDPTHGNVSFFGLDGQFTYHNDGTGVTDSFTYKACDASLCSAETTVTITIGNALNNHAPFVADDAIEVTSSGTATTLVGDPKNPGSVLDNDSDPDGDTLTATKLSDPAHGTLSQFHADGTFQYDNDGTSASVDSFLYQACDNHGACHLGVVTITIGNNLDNHLPIVVDDAIQVAPNGQTDTLIGDLNIPSSVLDNDSDPDFGDTLTTPGGACDLVNASGTLVIGTDGTFTYQNNGSPAANDMCLYQACDPHGACSTGIVHISVTNAPPDLPPIAIDDAIDVAPNGTTSMLVGDPNVPASVLDNDSDPDDAHNTLNAYVISPPTNGQITLHLDGTFTYVNTNPIADTFQYEVCDPTGACVPATVSVTINAAAPTVTCVLPTQVDVVGDTVSLDLSMLFTPPPGQTLTYSATNPPPALSIIGALLTGTLTASGTYTSTLKATTSPGGVSAGENVIFEVLPAHEIVFRNGFDIPGSSPPCP